jgi:hypothetical protein
MHDISIEDYKKITFVGFKRSKWPIRNNKRLHPPTFCLVFEKGIIAEYSVF